MEPTIEYLDGAVVYNNMVIPIDHLYDMAKNAQREERSRLTWAKAHNMNKILDEVCIAAGVNREEVFKKRRGTDDVVMVRYVFCVITKEIEGATHEEIARFLYNSMHNHSNVTTAIRVGLDRIGLWKNYRELYEESMKRLTG